MAELTGRILLVDDSELVQTMLADHLEIEGYEILTARDGEAGYARVLADKPDLVITDVQMPKMNGLELTRKLRGSEMTRQLPIVMITALNTVEDRIAGIEAGADDFISKPFNKQILMLKIRNLLKAGDLSRHLAQKLKELEQARATLERLQGEKQYTMEILGEELRNLGENLRGSLERLAAELAKEKLGEAPARVLAHALECSKTLSDKLNKAFQGH